MGISTNQQRIWLFAGYLRLAMYHEDIYKWIQWLGQCMLLSILQLFWPGPRPALPVPCRPSVDAQYGRVLIALVATSCESYKNRPHSLRSIVLIGGLEHFLLFHILGIIIQLTFIFFRGVETTNQCLFVCFVLFCFVLFVFLFVCLFVFSSWPILDSRPTQYMEFDVTSSPAFSPHDFLSGHMAFCTFIACKWYRYNVAPPVISWFISWFTSARN